MFARSRPRGSVAPFVVWALFGVVAVEIFVTYWRLPASVLWRVTGSGPVAGASRVLVFLGYPVALAAIAILVLLLDRLQGRFLRVLALVAIGLCAVGLAFVRDSNWDARPLNAIGAVGVTIAFLLTLAARSSPGRPVEGGWDRGDWVRLALAVVLFAMAVPSMAADLGFYLDRVPLLGSLYQTGAIRSEPGIRDLHVAVHHGHHEGMDGVLLAWSALLLWRCIPTVVNRRLRALFRAVLALLLCYGVAVAFGDFWLEQVAKRGWTDWTVGIGFPALTPGWGIIVAAAAVIGIISARPIGGRVTLAVLAVVIAVFGFMASAASGARHTDPLADVRGGRGPDISAVEASQSGMVLRFQVEFAKTAPLAFSARRAFTDMLLVTISTHGKRDPKQYDYLLGVHAAVPSRVMLVRRSGGRQADVAPAIVAGHTLTLLLDSRRIGDPERIMFAVFAGREYNNRAGGGGDSAPNQGSYAFELLSTQWNKPR